MVFEFITVVVVIGGLPETERDTGVLLEGEHDTAPMVCPMVVVFPDIWV